ncbi:hypothetical protein TrVE_jg5887 [Triparma verrucosa]|uniref:Myb-like domain-containing protein n=1 Tax=Triparma verrucosa TaxID=1606542 RepID=A0A9W7FF19_9STRA|nr:hypothetical protein TrVE_jg5887 [Triparma verrucosa]
MHSLDNPNRKKLTAQQLEKNIKREKEAAAKAALPRRKSSRRVTPPAILDVSHIYSPRFKWSNEEDSILIEAVGKFGGSLAKNSLPNSMWEEISKLLPGRGPSGVSTRWRILCGGSVGVIYKDDSEEEDYFVDDNDNNGDDDDGNEAYRNFAVEKKFLGNCVNPEKIVMLDDDDDDSNKVCVKPQHQQMHPAAAEWAKQKQQFQQQLQQQLQQQQQQNQPQ